MRVVGRVLGIHYKTVSLWLVRVVQSLPASPPQTEAYSIIEINETLHLYQHKESQCWLWLAVDSIFCMVFCFDCRRRTIKTCKILWQQFKYLPTMGWQGPAESLREFHSTRQALRGKDLHHANRITQLPTEALSRKASS